MHVGIDFDNTIVCYDAVFHRVALERGLIPASLPASKQAVRDHLRRTGREEDWIELQGLVYGARLGEAAPFPGVHEFFRACRAGGASVSIISHKTRHPFAGPKYDLHRAAREWIEQQCFFGDDGAAAPGPAVYFELTLPAKLERIAQAGCTHFIDDLPELLGEPGFPAGVERVLFDPAGMARSENPYLRAASWGEIARVIL